MLDGRQGLLSWLHSSATNGCATRQEARTGRKGGLLLGYGAIGQLVERRLQFLEVEVTVVRRKPDGTGKALGPDQWREQLGEFHWIILAVPATAETRHLIGAAELAADEVQRRAAQRRAWQRRGPGGAGRRAASARRFSM